MAHSYKCDCCGHKKWYDDILPSTISLCTFPKDDKYYCLEFGVPKEWFRKALHKLEFKMKMDSFLDEYTWDMTYHIYQLAKSDGVILWKYNQE